MKKRCAFTDVPFFTPSSYIASASSPTSICIYRTIDDVDARMGFSNFDTQKICWDEWKPQVQ